MSRYNLPSRVYGWSVAVGFDRPMECYFFQLWDPTQEEPSINIDTRKNYEILELMKAHVYMSDSTAQFVYDAISGDYDPEIWAEMLREEAERAANVKQMFDLVGKPVPK